MRLLDEVVELPYVREPGYSADVSDGSSSVVNDWRSAFDGRSFLYWSIGIRRPLCRLHRWRPGPDLYRKGQTPNAEFRFQSQLDSLQAPALPAFIPLPELPKNKGCGKEPRGYDPRVCS